MPSSFMSRHRGIMLNNMQNATEVQYTDAMLMHTNGPRR